MAKVVTDGDTCQASEGMAQILAQDGRHNPPHQATPPAPPPPRVAHAHLPQWQERAGA